MSPVDTLHANTSSPIGTRSAVSPASKRALAKAKTRHALLKSALHLYCVEGACGMSMNKIAQGAGIAQPSFYTHFDSVEALQKELSAQLKRSYLSPMRQAWLDMLQNYPALTKAQFNERCQICLGMIFEVAFQNIVLFQRLIEDRLRGRIKPDDSAMTSPAPLSPAPLSSESLSPKSLSKRRTPDASVSEGLGGLVDEIQQEWTEIFIQGLTSAERTFKRTEVHLCVDMAAAQVHELILGCHHNRYSRQQALAMLSQSVEGLFGRFF